MAVEEGENIAKRADSKEADEEEEEEIRSFEEMGLDPRLIRALSKKGITQPTPIQSAAIPLILVRRNEKINFNYFSIFGACL